MNASSSKSSPPKAKRQCQVKHETRDWLALPSDVMAKILSKLHVFDILENAQNVCTVWHKICKEPTIWRAIYINDPLDLDARSYISRPSRNSYRVRWKMYKHAVDRSQGQLVDFTIVGFTFLELLEYVADRSSQLKRLDVASCFCLAFEGWAGAFEKFPLLEELSIYSTPVSKELIETAGRCCPMLKTLKVNMCETDHWFGCEVNHNEKAIAIGENLCELRHLELIGSSMTNVGLQAILNGCRHLESFDLSECFNINLKGDLGKRCSEQIKCLILPRDITLDEDYINHMAAIEDYFNEFEFYDPDYQYEMLTRMAKYY